MSPCKICHNKVSLKIDVWILWHCSKERLFHGPLALKAPPEVCISLCCTVGWSNVNFYGVLYIKLSWHRTCIVIRSRKCTIVDNCITCTLTCHHAKSAITRCHCNWYLAYEHSIQTFIIEASQDISRRPRIWTLFILWSEGHVLLYLKPSSEYIYIYIYIYISWMKRSSWSNRSSMQAQQSMHFTPPERISDLGQLTN